MVTLLLDVFAMFMQVIPYISELLAKVHEQQAQAERIVRFQSQFGYVHAINIALVCLSSSST